MAPDPYALSTLLRSTGKTAREIVAAYNAAHPKAPISSPAVDSWMRPPGATRAPGRPRWSIQAGLADALNIPRATLFAACAGTTPDPSPLHAVTGSGLPVELCYHPDADNGSGRGWSVLIGDRTTYGDLDAMLARVAAEVPRG